MLSKYASVSRGSIRRGLQKSFARSYTVFDADSREKTKSSLAAWTEHQRLPGWVEDRIHLLNPSRVHLCDGSEEEYEHLLNDMVASGTLIKLNEKKRPNSYLARSDVGDVARVEENTFICSETENAAGPTNNWAEPEGMWNKMTNLLDNSMTGRTMYVVPFSMGPVGGPISQLGVQITDSPYVVASMRTMTRMGSKALEALGKDKEFVPCVHSLGAPLERGTADSPWPCNPDNKYIVHFPEQRRILSYGSGYGGNALLGKKCFALRIASAMARDEGWMAEHMLILGVTNPEGEKKYVAAAFPSACGKTNFAMMTPTLPGWKVECVGDDIAWMKYGKDGRLWAINPENGFFGVAPGTSRDTNPIAMDCLEKDAIFTNVALTDDNDVWWEGMTKDPPAHLKSWLRRDWYADDNDAGDAAHPNARFTVSASSCPVIDENWEALNGVPIDAIIFGGRRSDVIPLCFQSRDWQHGTYLGATMESETTAAAAGKRGVLRADPFAMKPFCGYNMGDYWQHWLNMGENAPEGKDKLPSIFYVNWFRKDNSGKFIWPGFGENSRVLKWIFERAGKDESNLDKAVETPIGLIPDYKNGGLDLSDLNISDSTMDELFQIQPSDWKKELDRHAAYQAQFGDNLPNGIVEERQKIRSLLDSATDSAEATG